MTATPKLSDEQFDDLYYDIVGGMSRENLVAKWGEATVAYGESHPVVKAALAYNARKSVTPA